MKDLNLYKKSVSKEELKRDEGKFNKFCWSYNYHVSRKFKRE